MSHLPWMKFAHVEFLLSPDMLGLSLQSQGALLRLMAHAARQTPYGTLPDDFDLIGRMVGKGWSKRIQQELFSGVFVATEDARWTCPLMTDVWADAPKANNDVTAEANTAKTNAQRQAEYKARQKGNATGNVTSNAENVTGNEIGNAQSNDGNVTSNEENVTFGGIKGGDLEKDLDQEIKNHTQTPVQVREDFSPNLEALNTKLKMAGGAIVDQKTLDQILVTFLPHYETQHLTPNQLTAKLVSWIQRDQSKPNRTSKTTASAKAKPVYGNVNDHWGNPPPPDLDTPFEVTEEFKAKMATLRVKS